MQAMDTYKRTSGRMFPTCSEILEVLRDLGYQQAGAPIAVPVAENEENSESHAEPDLELGETEEI